ncbi:hypothetical protein H6G54_28415 [Anabaena cylindrica FACHB-243]|uniref:Pepco domain-containing protein n=1 Tax=Anabaena cylindrica (strain ATCC 27899 / PCC 7122) TaxID=272123 RepID=K9ZI21_ANACC|nr:MULTISPECIES: hypothetical protein [Anabaena]AFZ58841.1 hypothetical protein Anacy_3441 [Anabaena cylindrica PCC 7122]MBD2421533.1 hypothetical protein [Anabaena cylindrica FACHB-243]MBY5282836.1 hypothetical protein [Anabaena sp. CCAP 1446/1C]MBY5311405.1 hypothetical protein [Anabaena sp. CCAP 1446/1C]MCM2410141.1 hypothetical protein [Anabaena sp. CCAP 1446/1C]
MTDNRWEDEELWIVTASTPGDRTKEGVKAVTGNGNPYSSPPVTVEEIKESRLKAGKLAAQMSQFVGIVSHLFSHVEKQIKPQAGLELDEVTLTVEISSEGEIKLLGTGVKAAGKGAIELKFKRSPKTPEN